jgi:hypothetical protein
VLTRLGDEVVVRINVRSAEISLPNFRSAMCFAPMQAERRTHYWSAVLTRPSSIGLLVMEFQIRKVYDYR